MRPSTPAIGIVWTSRSGAAPPGVLVVWTAAPRPQDSVSATSAIARKSMSVDGEVIELDHGVGLGPEADLPGIFERFVLRVEDLVAVVPDDEVVARGLHLERVPRILGDLDALVQERSPLAPHGVVDRAVVFIGVAARDVVVVGVLVPPDETEALIHLAGQRPRPDAESDVRVDAFLEDGDGKAVVRRVGALLDEDVVLVRSLLGPHDPLALRATARPRELEARRRLPDRVGLELSLGRAGGSGKGKDGIHEE